MTSRIEFAVTGVLAIAVGAFASGCSPSSSATGGSESSASAATASAPATPAMTVGQGCRKAILATKAYLSVSAQHPKEFLPGRTYSPAEAPEVREAAERAAAELRGVAGGMTEASVQSAMNAQIEDLDYVIAGSPDDPTTLDEFMDGMKEKPKSSVADLYRACGTAAPELAKDPELKGELRVHIGESGVDAQVD